MNEMLEKVERSYEVIEEAFERFESGKAAVMFSGGKDSLVLTRLVFDVIEKHNYEQPYVVVSDPIPFPQNEEYLKEMIEEFGIKKPIWWRDLLKLEHFRVAGKIAENKVRCCHALKVLPLNDFIKDYKIEAVFVAIRWDEHKERAKERHFSPRENPEHMRVHPILHFTWKDVWEYIKFRGLKPNPLYFKGFTSLGCKPCTAPVTDGFKDIDDIIRFIETGKVAERAGRDLDKELVMERLRRLGYF